MFPETPTHRVQASKLHCLHEVIMGARAFGHRLAIKSSARVTTLANPLAAGSTCWQKSFANM